MRFRFKPVLGLYLLLILLSSPLGAQQLPSLPTASGVVSGTLPNGIAFYLVSNPSSKGRADFALVQKGPVREESSRAALADLPHFQGERPYQFLAKLGVGYNNFGYLRSTEASTTYFFRDVPIDQAAVRDTTLLLLFDISETCPYEQAIIVCGDIDKNTIRERMDVFSMMVTSRSRLPEPEPYEWNPSETPVFRFVRSAPQDEASLTVRYSSPRTPREAMNTAQPLVTGLFAEELGVILKDRLERAFRSADIPLAQASAYYRGSDRGPGAEQYSLTVTVGRDDLARATETVGAVLGELDAHGASLSEFQGAKERFLSSLAPAGRAVPNEEWVEKCSSAFLYGAGLTDPAYVRDFFSSRNIASQRELELFNDYVSALLDPSKAVTLRYVSPSTSLDEGPLKTAFAAGWDASSGRSGIEYSTNPSDTLGLYVTKVKSKLRHTVSEPMTGGELWTFANGMRVIFKRSAGEKGSFTYGFLLNGGFSDVPSLAQGEGGFIADMLMLSDIGGLQGPSFLRMLESNGIGIETAVSLTDLRLTGHAPSPRLELLLKSLATLSRERAVNREAYEYYRKSERLRLSMDRKRYNGINAVVDSIMCPDYRYMAGKHPSGLTDDLPERAAEYFDGIFSRCNDGVLVLVGDLDPYALKKILPKYMGAFVTGGRPSARPQVDFNLRSGWSTYTVEAGDSVVGSGEPCITVAESAVLPFTLERYYSFRVAAMELKKHLALALAPMGMYAEVSDDIELFPAERLILRIVCRSAEEDGLPADVVPEDPLRVLGIVRGALADFTSSGPSAASLAASKATFIAGLDAQMSDPEFLVEAAMVRYSLGKDLVTGYKSRAGAVSAASVREILSALDSGSKVEYVVY